MFSNVLMTTLTPLCNTDENSCWENRPFTTIWPEEQQSTRTTRMVNQPKSAELKKTIKKKKRYRTAFNTEQLKVLENTYYRIKYISQQERRQLAETLNISERSIKVWFQNRRMKEKKESSESSDSSTEAIGLEEFLAPLSSTTPSIHDVDVPVTPDIELGHYNNAYSEVGLNWVSNNHFSDYSCQDLSNCYFCNPVQSQSLAASMLPPPEPFADDRSTYPTSYYPTLVDYFCGENYNESGDVAGADVQWSANNFDLNYF